ncbi:adenylate cyclase [Mesorhizobium sp. M0016]|uniref:winged helix-turn-helix domain-containing tetratricopeptide repeat protein n=1 Tax=Mesorhizobium sp. M0016 TaxID=2956843 RepID=UPI0033393A7D
MFVQIATLRKALGRADQGGDWIATVPRVGYRFTAPVERVEGSVQRSIAPSGKPTIAVLPFANLSGEQDQQYLSDGITEDIITEVGRYRSLVVIARNSSFQFRGPAPEAAEVHRQLGARYLVEGSVRRLGSRIRITAQLTDGASGFHLWAQRYDRALEDIFSVQEEVAALVASTVQGATEADATSRSRRTPPADWAAYDYYLQGRAHYHQYEMDKGESMFTRSAELDPAFAQGHAYLAQCLVARFWYDRDPRTLQSASRSARTALLLDRNDGICNQSMGLVLVHMRQHGDAGLHFQQARTLNPHDVNIAGDYASWLNYGGQPQQSLAVLERAKLLDPLPPVWFWEVKGSALFLLGRYADHRRLSEGRRPVVHPCLSRGGLRTSRRDGKRACRSRSHTEAATGPLSWLPCSPSLRRPITLRALPLRLQKGRLFIGSSRSENSSLQLRACER